MTMHPPPKHLREQLQAERQTAVFGEPHPAVLVTGSGAKRVGRAIAQHLALLGYRLALHANRSVDEAQAFAQELTAAGTETLVVCGDLSDEATARRVIDQAANHFGRLDGLVNAAAMWRPIPLEQVDAAEVRRNFEVNALSVFICSQQAGLRMVQQPFGGAIINLGDWAIARPYLNYSAYFPSKGAVQTITRDLAVELAARNPRVRVNCILPGPVMLPPELSAEERREAVAGTLVQREGTPEHVAHAVAFLLENDFITGVSLPVDGGRTLK